MKRAWPVNWNGNPNGNGTPVREPGRFSGSKKASLAGKVILLMNGLHASGRRLAGLLAEQGADVAVIDSRFNPSLAAKMRTAVHSCGRRCLIITRPSPAEKDLARLSLADALQTINSRLGRIDAAVSYPNAHL